jgi:hypothetical protein
LIGNVQTAKEKAQELGKLENLSDSKKKILRNSWFRRFEIFHAES